MQLDGNAKTQAATLSAKIQKYETLLSNATQDEDPVLFKLCTDTIAEAKSQRILLNSPQDQLRNLRGAFQRQKSLHDDLTSQISSITSRLDLLKDRIADNLNREQQLIAIITDAPPILERPPNADATNEQFQLLHAQIGAMQQEREAERDHMRTQMQLLMQHQGISEEAKLLIPDVPSPPLEEPFRGYDDFSNVPLEADSFGPSCNVQQRASPYGMSEVVNVDGLSSVDSILPTNPFLGSAPAGGAPV